MKKTNLILILCLFNLIHAKIKKKLGQAKLAGSLYQRQFIPNLSSYGPVIPVSSNLPAGLTAEKYTQNCVNNWNVCFWGLGQPNNAEECDRLYQDQNGMFLNTCYYEPSWS